MRGVGKSTWVRAILPKVLYIGLLNECLYQDLLIDPGDRSQPSSLICAEPAQRLTSCSGLPILPP